MIDMEAALATDRDALTAILPRVNAMNSFIRSAEHNRHCILGSLPYVVYHYKREAIARGHGLGMATHRRSDVRVKCNRCGGSGRYTDQYGYTHDGCRHCSSSGTAHLRFVETALPGALWLTPEREAWSFMGWREIEELPQTTENWQVNQVGKDLTPPEVADHLNEIEAFFPKRPPAQQGEYGSFDIYGTYRLWVGETSPASCFLCRQHMEEPYGGHAIVTGRLHWNARICRACDAQYKGADVFSALSVRMPSEFITPEISRWIERHPVQEKARIQP